jgi:hypothetical protein
LCVWSLLSRARETSNYFVSFIYVVKDATLNQLLFRYAQPIGRVLIRTTLPVITSAQPSQAPLPVLVI